MYGGGCGSRADHGHPIRERPCGQVRLIGQRYEPLSRYGAGLAERLGSRFIES